VSTVAEHPITPHTSGSSDEDGGRHRAYDAAHRADTTPDHRGRHRSTADDGGEYVGRHRADPDTLSVWATAQSTGPVQRRGR
jgi:hypothetical protein